MKKQQLSFVLLIAGSMFCVLPQQAQAQVSKETYVPCQEMPTLIQQYGADNRTLSRYYSPASSRSGGFGGADASIGSPEKNRRLQQLIQEYQKKISSCRF